MKISSRRIEPFGIDFDWLMRNAKDKTARIADLEQRFPDGVHMDWLRVEIDGLPIIVLVMPFNCDYRAFRKLEEFSRVDEKSFPAIAQLSTEDTMRWFEFGYIDIPFGIHRAPEVFFIAGRPMLRDEMRRSFHRVATRADCAAWDRILVMVDGNKPNPVKRMHDALNVSDLPPLSLEALIGQIGTTMDDPVPERWQQILARNRKTIERRATIVKAILNPPPVAGDVA